MQSVPSSPAAHRAGPAASTAPPGPSASASAVVRRLLAPGAPAFALLHRAAPGRAPGGGTGWGYRPRPSGSGGALKAVGDVEVLIGPVTEADRLADIPLPSGAPGGARPVHDVLALVPFRQIRERGFDVRDDGAPLALLIPQEVCVLPLADVLAALPGHEVRVADGAFDVGDEDYAGIVARVVREEIGAGEGANFVVRRDFCGRIENFGAADALALFRRLLAGERGAYWTFVVHTADRTLVGASPEVHVRMSGGRPTGDGGREPGTVVMNPISGTYRYPAQGPSVEGVLHFLGDGKETEELSMVVDEELKMMCAVGDMGGVVVGPRLREMAHLAHTEYELRGRSSLDVREVLRETMFAATVTGSPVQNACRVIERHEGGGHRHGGDAARGPASGEPSAGEGKAPGTPLPSSGKGGRGYYGGALALIGRDASGAQTLDSPIIIRTADIAADGRLRVPVGATLVRGSDPAGEVAETHAKAAGVLAALGVRPVRPPEERAPLRLADDPRVQAALDGRRAALAPFWLRMQEMPVESPGASAAGSATGAGGSPVGSGGGTGHPGHALVVDAEDTFTAMLAHLLRSTGLEVTVRRYDERGLQQTVAAHRGPVVLGPGPGNPTDTADPKMRLLRALTANALRTHRHGLLGVCLGHELIAAELGLEIVRGQVPYQGAQCTVELFGRTETVGFYSSFTARCGDARAAELALSGVEVSRDARSGEVHAVRGRGMAGVQFHPESVLTLRGAGIVRELVSWMRRVGEPTGR